MSLHLRASRAAFLAGAAAGAAWPRIATSQALPQITIGTSPIDGAIGVVAALRAGYFTKYGLDASLSVANGAANAAAVTGGSLQFAASNIVTLIKAHLHGLPFAIVAPGAIYTTENPTQVLVVPKTSPLRTAADLNGKTIGTTALGDILAQSTLAWIDAHGGNSASVHLVEIPQTAIEGALHTGRIDAATMAEPHLSEAVGDGSVVIFAKIFDAIAPRFAESAYFAMPAYIDAHRDITVRFAKAILSGNVFANDHPNRTAPWLVESAKVDLASVQHARREQFPATLDPAQIQVVIDALVRMKAIDRSFAATDMISPVVIGVRP
jgi:NitT/TauT family transport system substrate-binding protein